MESITEELLNYYDENPNFDSWDFEKIKKQIDMDIFILNKDNVIIHSTFASDIGRNFNFCCTTLAKILDERRADGGFFHDGMDVAQETGDVTKYSNQATRDKKYIIELGVNLQEREVFQEFNFLHVIRSLEEEYPSIQKINVLNIGGLSLGNSAEGWEPSPERHEAFKKAIETHQTTECEGTWKGEKATFRYVPYGSDYDFGSTQSVLSIKRKRKNQYHLYS